MYFILKRYLDLLFASICFFLLLPLFLIIAIAIKCDSCGPIIFKQGRLSKNGREFQMYKFRTMVVNAENTGSGLFNYENDPRVTKVGKFLRNTSLDELPQLINVIKGDMSLVGPRPPVTYELGDYETLNNKYKKRFTVLPGITGLAQVSGRNELPWDEKVDYDNKYVDLIKEHGLTIDIEILIKTLINVFKRKNIYEKKLDMARDDELSAVIAAEEVIAKAHAKETD
jgi:lipopolysaccharide/colanic/teichoic acid biosynthesis glycosyltransferase